MRFLVGICCFLTLPLASGAESTIAEITLGAGTYRVQKLSDEHGIIWGLDFLDKNTLIFTEKTGAISTMDIASRQVKILKNPPRSAVHGQGGLLDITVHPQFDKNKRVYVTYTKNVDNQFTTAAAWAQLSNGTFGEWKEFFVGVPANKKMEHFGARLVFDGNGYLFMSIGDRGVRENAQKLTSHTGKILRFKDDGTVPSDNPFIKIKDAKPEIWSYGHRNPQGLYYDTANRALFEMEHGPQGGDEINIIKKGGNYGWPVITFGKEYGSGSNIGEGAEKKGMEQPFKYYVPSIAPSGMVIYNSTKLPDFSGFIVSGSLVLTHLNLIKKQEKEFCEIRLLKAIGDRVRDVIEGPDQLLYFTTDSGKILRIEPVMVGKVRSLTVCPKAVEKIL